MPRTVRALVSCRRELLGAVPPFDVQSPWWPDVAPVVAHLDALLGVPTTVLRLVSTRGGDSPAGGTVTYHVEAAEPPSFPFQPHPADGLFEAHPLRAPYAYPGGVAEIVAWADAALQAVGVRRTGRVRQVKTWNLSCVLSIATDAGLMWCKSTRPFETPEHVPIALVGAQDPALAPAVIAHRATDVLLADVAGEDCWKSSAEQVGAMVSRWVSVQAALADQPLAGLPERLPGGLAERLEPVLTELPGAERAGVAELLAGLPGRLARLDACGLPITVVHGDFHSGNWRAGSAALRLMDWSDAFLGHPANDIVRLIDWAPAIPAPLRPVALDAWCAAWRAARPGCDPVSAVELVRPLVFGEAACAYQRFLDGIEPSERPYHEGDPLEMVRMALSR